MSFVITLVIVFIVGYLISRLFKKKSLPSNRYTPYDDLTMQNIKPEIQEEAAEENDRGV
ncbi:DUF3951 domain-containing protein [Falsibacillus albus]|uniref:DUF3951 domain-containing protein n=1 Tax=Falsibacillus albus TaxID=2478915 RepID=A0A3L7JZ72_9BACI|nr:DUF3951 domain-containing protein [Falsibacillus albus]RLQ93682.1 DUF3951 domain-containing protein [Falsibacillus albus]